MGTVLFIKINVLLSIHYLGTLITPEYPTLSIAELFYSMLSRQINTPTNQKLILSLGF